MAQGNVPSVTEALMMSDGRPNPVWYRYWVSGDRNTAAVSNSVDDATLLLDGSTPPYADEASDDLTPPIALPDAEDNLAPPYVEPDPNYRSATQTVVTDADFTIEPSPLGLTVLHTGTLTAGRTVTLSTASAIAGTTTRVTRSGAGAFNLSIGGLKNLATGTWADVEYDGAAWFLSAYGAL